MGVIQIPLRFIFSKVVFVIIGVQQSRYYISDLKATSYSGVRKKRKTFEEAAAELGEARPLEDVLRRIVKPEKKKEPKDDRKK